jgi:hypothetical protein
MDLLDVIEQPGGGGWRIELRQGDLTNLGSDEAVDLLVVSAFPNDFTPTSGSLIGALYERGLSVRELSGDKDIDIRDNYSCWLSKPIAEVAAGLRFGRILCFEPVAGAAPPERVGDIFRGLAPILIVRPEIRSLAMPIVAAGDRGYPVPRMLTPLLDAAMGWLANGLPLERIIIAAHGDDAAEQARAVFAAARARPEGTGAPSGDRAVDVFISYCQTDSAVADALLAELRSIRPNIQVFMDREDLRTGSHWLTEIFESLERARKVAVLLSPSYLASKACQDEFNVAWIETNRTNRRLIHPLFIYDTALPAHFRLFQYDNCREGDLAKVRAAAERLVQALDADG